MNDRLEKKATEHPRQCSRRKRKKKDLTLNYKKQIAISKTKSSNRDLRIADINIKIPGKFLLENATHIGLAKEALQKLSNVLKNMKMC